MKIRRKIVPDLSPKGRQPLVSSTVQRTCPASYVANAHANAVAVVTLAPETDERSTVRGFIPTGQYPSAVAVVAGRLFIGNGKGTGFESSSLTVNQTGLAPNLPNQRFSSRGQYILSLISGNISLLPEPDDLTLAGHTQLAMRNNGLLGPPRADLFDGASPIKHPTAPIGKIPPFLSWRTMPKTDPTMWMPTVRRL